MKQIRFRKTTAKNLPAEPLREAEREADDVQEVEPDEILEQSTDAQARILAREQERIDREAAMAEYKAEKEAELKKTARLRAARLPRSQRADSPGCRA